MIARVVSAILQEQLPSSLHLCGQEELKQLFFLCFLFLPEEKDQTNTSRLCLYLPCLGTGFVVSRYCKFCKKRNSSVFIAAVMQCSFFSALQLHSHSRLSGLGDERYWAEKLDARFLHRSTIGMGLVFEDRLWGRTPREASLVWAKGWDVQRAGPEERGIYTVSQEAVKTEEMNRGVWGEGVLVCQGPSLFKCQRTNLCCRWHFLVRLPFQTGDGKRRGWKGPVLEKCLPP